MQSSASSSCGGGQAIEEVDRPQPAARREDRHATEEVEFLGSSVPSSRSQSPSTTTTGETGRRDQPTGDELEEEEGDIDR